MTGSNVVAIVVPIASLITLAAWLAAIFYADKHPLWRDRTGAAQDRALTAQERQAAVRSPGQTETPQVPAH